MNKETFRIAQKAFITNEKGELLVVRFSHHEKLIPENIRGTWDFPGGGLEYLEDLKEGLLREIREELGDVRITIRKPIATWTFTIQNGEIQKKGVYCVVIGYEGVWEGGTIMLNEEHDQYQWIHPDVLPLLKWGNGNDCAMKQYLTLRNGAK